MGFPVLDPRPLYLHMAANTPMANPYLQNMRGHGPPPTTIPTLPTTYLHSLAQFHNLKVLATKTMMEQQNLAKSLLQASLQNSKKHLITN